MKNNLGIGLILLVAAGLASAANQYVALQGTNTTAPYETWARATTNIQAAVNAAGANETVYISNGTYYLSGTITVSSDARLRSWNNGAIDRDGTRLNGGGVNRGLNLQSAGAVLEGLTITNCYTNASGGGVNMTAGLITNCAVAGCYATNGFGGGVYMTGGLVTHCLIQNNTATYRGGGVYVSGASTRLINSDIQFNQAISAVEGYGGGGVWVSAGIASNCTVQYNFSGVSGGGFFMTGSGWAIGCSNISYNRAGASGGGVSIDEGGGVSNCVIACNTSVWATTGSSYRGGGGVYIYRMGGAGNFVVNSRIISNATQVLMGGAVYIRGIGTLRNCTIERNTTGIEGYGSIRIDNYGSLENCIIRDNICPNYGGGLYLNIGNDILLRNCLITGNSVTNTGSSIGGGIYVYAGTNSRLESCTISSNWSKWRGGGIVWNLAAANTVRVDNCIAYFNLHGSGEAGISNWYDMNGVGARIFNCNCMAPSVAGYGGIGNVDGNPQFVNSTSDNWRLTASSPCVNTGTNQAWMGGAVDLDGRPRLDHWNSKADMGAYEYFSSGTLIRMR